MLEYIDNAERSERFLRAKFKIKANNTSFRLFKVWNSCIMLFIYDPLYITTVWSFPFTVSLWIVSFFLKQSYTGAGETKLFSNGVIGAEVI